MTETPKCALCGEPMPPGETMFKFHGYSGPCPAPPLDLPAPPKPQLYTRDIDGNFHPYPPEAA